MKPLRIATMEIAPAIALAPMEGVTDRPVRRLIRSLGGCGIAFTEFVSSEALTREVEAAKRTAAPFADEHPVAIQIFGRDPERMAAAARECEELGADLVDVNLGCPSRRVTGGCAGSALLREPAHVRGIFRAVGSAVRGPWSVKMRLGWDDACLNAAEIAAAAEAEGASLVTVHARTRADAFRGRARWALVAPVVQAVRIPVLVNGDIVDGATAKAALRESGAAGVMVGRAIQADPFALRGIADELTGRPAAWVRATERREAFRRYCGWAAEESEAPQRTVARARQVAGWFVRSGPGAAAARQRIGRASGLDEICTYVDSFLERGTASRRGSEQAASGQGAPESEVQDGRG